jgi:hypothetical protein
MHHAGAPRRKRGTTKPNHVSQPAAADGRTAHGVSASAVCNARHAVIASVGAPSGAVPPAHDHPSVMQRKE